MSEKVTGSSSPQELSEELLKKEDAERRLAKEKRKLRSMKKRAQFMISQLQDPVQQNIMKERYLWGWGWERIRQAIGYSERESYRKHEQALNELTDRSQIPYETWQLMAVGTKCYYKIKKYEKSRPIGRLL